jgi:intracellular septation protein
MDPAVQGPRGDEYLKKDRKRSDYPLYYALEIDHWRQKNIMKMFYDFFPIIIFFIVYKIWGIYAATVAAIAVSGLQLAIHWLRHRRVDHLQIITFFLILILGSLTIFLHNPRFIQWKPTVIYWAFAITFVGSHFIGKKPVICYLLDKKVTLPTRVWTYLSFSWVVFFIIVGTINLFVVYLCSESTWVNFKLFGVLGLTLLFAIAQSFYLARHVKNQS